MSIIVPIIMGSDSDLEYTNQIHNEMKNKFYDLKIILVNRISSSHKSGINLLKILAEYENNPNVLCLVTVTNESNLSSFVDGHTSKLVISNVPHKSNISYVNMSVTKNTSSGTAPLIVFGAENAALAIVKLAATKYPEISRSIKRYHEINQQKLRILDIIQKYSNISIDTARYDQWKNSKSLDYLDDYRFVRSGKVRDIYEKLETEDRDNSLANGHPTMLISASDRLSAFDRDICNIPYKGNILNSISVWWFEQTKKLVPNHFVSQVNSTDIIVKKCKPIPIEFVVRGYVAGTGKTSLWYNYSRGYRFYCGHNFPEGLKKNQKLPFPLITPTTKDVSDELISQKDIVEKGILTQDQWNRCAEYALKLFDYGQKKAKENGLILVDTKYEFGFDENDNILLIDEIHTPDSSRYWFKHNYQDRYNRGQDPESIDKEIMRRWIRDNYDPYDQKVTINVPQDMKDLITRRYIQLYEIITDDSFVL